MRKIKIVENEFYHIYNRGVGKQTIFHDMEDYNRFLKLMYLANSNKKFKFKELIKVKKDIFEIEINEKIVNLGMYVLMPNHFHLIVSTSLPEGGKKISLFLNKLSTGYAQYYNQKYNRTGTLFESRYKAIHIKNDNYFKYLFSYIHLNPIKLLQSDWKDKGIKNINNAKIYLQKFTYSSYLDYFNTPFPEGGRRGQERIISKDSILKMFPKNVDLKKEIFEWLNYKNDF